MIAQVSNYVLGAIGVCNMFVLTTVIWISRAKVNHKTFDVERENNKTDHENIRKWIEDSEQRLTKKLDKIEDLIRKNGNSQPRIRN